MQDAGTIFEFLGLLDSCSVDELDLAWKKARSSIHPDRGGDAGTFSMRANQYNKARAVIATRRCVDCDGLGYTVRMRGFNELRTKCKRCHGAGRG